MNKFKFLLHLCGILNSFLIYAQIGIGTPTPHEKASLHLAEENKTLILNKVTDKEAISNPYDGMIFYDASEKCFRGYANGTFTDCFGAKPSDPVIRVKSGGFEGEFVRDQVLSNAFYKVTITNNSFRETTLGFSTADLELSAFNSSSGPNTSIGITVSAVYSLESTDFTTEEINVNFPIGATKTIVYKLSGSPIAPYMQILASWSKITLTNDGIVDVTYKVNCSQGSWTTALPSINKGFLKNNEVYNLVYSVPIPNSEGFVFEAVEIEKSGLTLLRPLTNGSSDGNLIYTISGTYTGIEAESLDFGILDGCPFEVGRYPVNCLEIQTLNNSGEFEILNTQNSNGSGQFKIDVDGSAGFEPIDCYCDMVTDGGGWTLVLNYNHLAATNPELVERKSSLPILGSEFLGTNEAKGIDGSLPPVANGEVWAKVNNAYWGHAHADLLSKMQIQSLRFYGETSKSHNRVIHFKTKKVTAGMDSSQSTQINNLISSFKTSYLLPEINSTNVSEFLEIPYGKVRSFLPFAASSNYGFSLFIFAKDGSYHWSIKSFNANGIPMRWDVDDDSYQNNDINLIPSTIHQVWIR